METIMKKCETCGNVYHGAFHIEMNGKYHTFDSFECAISKLAPKCTHCKTRIIGHGVESAKRFFCCNHCAESYGIVLKKQA